MLCNRCATDMTENAMVYRLTGFYGYYCLNCVTFLSRKLGLPTVPVINLPYYTD